MSKPDIQELARQFPTLLEQVKFLHGTAPDGWREPETEQVQGLFEQAVERHIGSHDLEVA